MSSLDEFLQRRVPIQLGGLQDPFSPMENSRKVTLRLLKTLQRYQYPTIISSKGDLFLAPEYLEILKNMNVYVRLSAAGVAARYRSNIDFGCGTFDQTLVRIRSLAKNEIPVSLRIQPIIPGFENDALRMAQRASNAGVQHVSFEYLKIASEEREQTARRIGKAVHSDIWAKMQTMGLSRIGRDYSLKPESKIEFLRKARALCHSNDIKFGAGDTEFIPHSDGDGCCSGAGQFLEEANEFKSNFAGIVKLSNSAQNITFSDLESLWSPTHAVNTYLTTNSRNRDRSGLYTDWISLVAHRWNGSAGPYSPEFFEGVSWNGDMDDRGFKIYKFHDVLGSQSTQNQVTRVKT